MTSDQRVMVIGTAALAFCAVVEVFRTPRAPIEGVLCLCAGFIAGVLVAFDAHRDVREAARRAEQREAVVDVDSIRVVGEAKAR